MPFIPALNTIECEVRLELDDQQVENTLYFSLNTAWTAPTMLTHAQEVANWWATELGPQTATAVVLREVYVTDLTTATSAAVSYVSPTTLTGSRAVEPLPNSVSLVTSFRTTSRGRSYRGRNYFIGLCEDQVLGNTVDAGVLVALREAYEDLLPGGALTRGVWSVVSRFSGVDPTTNRPIPRAAAVVTPITTVVIVDDTVDNQRRRLPGRGR